MRRLKVIAVIAIMILGLVLWSCVSVRVITGEDNKTERMDSKTGVDSEINSEVGTKRDSIP